MEIIKQDIWNQAWDNPKPLLAIYSPSSYIIYRSLCQHKGASELTRIKKMVICLHKIFAEVANIIYTESKLFSTSNDIQVKTSFLDTMTECSNPVFLSIFPISILPAHIPLRQVVWLYLATLFKSNHGVRYPISILPKWAIQHSLYEASVWKEQAIHHRYDIQSSFASSSDKFVPNYL